jgi:hypothetical protein
MNTKKRNHPVWDVNKSVNYFFSQEAAEEHKEKLDALAELLPEARNIAEAVTCDLIRMTSLEGNSYLASVDPGGHHFVGETINPSTLDKCTPENDAILLRSGSSVINWDMVKSFKADMAKRYREAGLEHHAGYLERVTGVGCRTSVFATAQGRALGQDPARSRPECNKYSGVIPSSSWMAADMGNLNSALMFGSNTTNANSVIHLNRAKFCAAPWKIEKYLRMVSPTLIAAWMYPELAESIETTCKRTFRIDYLANIMQILPYTGLPFGATLPEVSYKAVFVQPDREIDPVNVILAERKFGYHDEMDLMSNILAASTALRTR